LEIVWRGGGREVKRRERRAPNYLPRLACRAEALAKAGPQILFQPGEGGFKGGIGGRPQGLPVREIGDAIFADFF